MSMSMNRKSQPRDSKVQNRDFGAQKPNRKNSPFSYNLNLIRFL